MTTTTDEFEEFTEEIDAPVQEPEPEVEPEPEETTGAELAVIEPETVAVELLSKADAKRLDKKIRSASDRTVAARDKAIQTFEELKELLVQAREGQIHKALGLKSWTAYVSDAVALPQAPEREERKELVLFMSGQGMSQRAIAKMVGVSQKTVDRDLTDAEVEPGATVTSLDGAERPRKGKQQQPEPDYIDAEVVEQEEESSSEPMTAAAIVEAFEEEMTNMWQAHSELTELTREDKWGGARKRVVKAHLNNLQQVATNIQLIIDDLMTD